MNRNINALLLLMMIVSGIPIASIAQNAVQGNNIFIGGYGELHYNRPTVGVPKSEKTGTLDFHRFVLYTGYRFSNKIMFNSELEVEHTRVEAGAGGEVAVEQAYLDYVFKPEFGARAGIMLVPVGLVNLYHEPPSFFGVERPSVEQAIIPSTWREAGAGIFGRFQNGISYKLYLMAGLDPSGLAGESGIEESTQEATRSSTENAAIAARLDYDISLSLKAGISYFYSGLQNSKTTNGSLKGATLNMVEGHVQYSGNNIQLSGVAVYSHIAQSDKINRYYGTQVGSGQYGIYGVAAYDLLGLANTTTEQRLWLFVRPEKYNTQASTSGFQADKTFDHTDVTLGLSYYPLPNVVVKADYQWFNHAAGINQQQFNLGIGYNF